MTKELFVSSTPHETKVGIVEDDLLAEIYLERENEYTLAGSVYKGRVTRVLPGMQSAFVDVGLERDAFLYVSDFMELPDEEELEEIPTSRNVHSEGRQGQAPSTRRGLADSRAGGGQPALSGRDHALGHRSPDFMAVFMEAARASDDRFFAAADQLAIFLLDPRPRFGRNQRPDER